MTDEPLGEATATPPAPPPGHPYATEIEAERRGWAELLRLVRSLTPEEWILPGYYSDPDWTVRDLVAHVGTWLAEAQIQFARMSAGSYMGHEIDIDGLNAAMLDAMSGQPWDVAYVQASAGRTLMLDEWYRLSERNDEAAWWIRKSASGHYGEHLPQLRDWVGELVRAEKWVTDGPPNEVGWPALPWHEWADSMATLHMWTQIVGKIKLARSPKPAHPWLVALHVTEFGLTTGAVPYDGREFSIDFDFAEHCLRASEGGGRSFRLDLTPMTVADFYRQLMAGLAGMDIAIPIRMQPFDVVDPIPFDVDDVHHSYEPDQVAAFWAGLRVADRALKDYQAPFLGEAGPVVFYWGSFDVATSRFSDSIESACGWWPLDRRVGPAFYAYSVPAPVGFKEAGVAPAAARFDETLGEFILPWDAVRAAADPAGDVRAFLDSTCLAGAPAVTA